MARYEDLTGLENDNFIVVGPTDTSKKNGNQRCWYCGEFTTTDEALVAKGMNDEYKEYCEQTAKVFAMSMEQVNSSMMNLMQSAKLGAESLGMFKELTKDS